ncbi:MAG: protein TolQ [Bdellovibrionales bacterium RBG_16_40_8]|nr:MAG: protein TolQ [Bdellovibrionales bacterium RBG_16_40_8]
MASASWPVQLTLLLLAGASVVCWAIIFTKKRSLDSLRRANSHFLTLFWKASSLDDIFEKIANHASSNIAVVFRSGYLELRKMADSNLSQSKKDQATPLLSGIDNLERAIKKSIDVEVTKIENRLSFLATVGSTSPFVGLFGTVWGIMGAFHKIGATGMANLAVVAPGISEALIATAIGLVVAIPATIAYNHFSTRIQREELELNSFAADFLNIAKRNFFKDS